MSCCERRWGGLAYSHLPPGPRSTRVPGALTITAFPGVTFTAVRGALTTVPACLLDTTCVPGATTVVPEFALEATVVPGAVTVASRSLRALCKRQTAARIRLRSSPR